MSIKSTYISYGSVDSEIGVLGGTLTPSSSFTSKSSYKDELLHSDDKPLELTLNCKPPMTINRTAEVDRNNEVLKKFKSERFTRDHQRKLTKKFSLNSEEDNTHRKTLLKSSNTASFGGSSARSKSLNAYPEPKVNDLYGSREISRPMAKLKGHENVTRKSSLNDSTPLEVTTASPKTTRKTSTLPRTNTHPLTLLPPSSDRCSSTRNERGRSMKNKKDKDSRSHSRSSSTRRFLLSFKNRRTRSSSRDRSTKRSNSQSSANTEDRSSPITSSELSSDVNLPGILKVFGDALSPGANYKSIMATSSSNAKELVKMALERYGVARHQAKYHVLCEVVGKITDESSGRDASKLHKTKANKNKQKFVNNSTLKDDHDFKEEYVRPLSDHEKPLILQSYWKPLKGHCRRFEIRRRSKVFQNIEKDHATREINTQARKLVMQKLRNKLSLSSSYSPIQTDSEEEDDEKITSFDLYSSDSKAEEETLHATNFFEGNCPSKTKTIEVNAQAALNSCVSVDEECVATTADRVTPDGGNVNSCLKSKLKHDSKPSDSPPNPYLITLQGNEDSLIHSIQNDEVLIGSEVNDFKLTAPDVLRHHCVIKKRLEILFSEHDDYKIIKRWCVTITPLSSTAEVRINGSQILSKHLLQHGELVSVGQRHMFMYKDPSSNINLSSVVTFSLSSTTEKDTNLDYDVPGRSSDNAENSGSINDFNPSLFVKTIETDFTYPHELEDRILNEIFCFPWDLSTMPEGCALSPAVVLCQCIIHSCLNFKQQDKNNLLLKISNTLQSLILNATRDVSVLETNTSDTVQDGVRFLSFLQPVFFWMSNSLEIFEFLKKDLIPLIHKRVAEEKEKGSVDQELIAIAESSFVNKEVLSLLEEAVMLAFQKIVHYFTKILFGCLPAILECNPFTQETSSTLCVSHVTEVYAHAREMTQRFDVNKQITDQLFACLFFFTNVSLFNSLMEDDAATKYFRWEMGVRIQGNLEFIEVWAAESGHADQCATYLEKISSLANLLATPRGQFIKSSWSSFRQTYPLLAPAQLQKVLTGYHLPSKQTKPKTWTPKGEDVDKAKDIKTIMESYDTHLSSVLPTSQSKMPLSLSSSSPWLNEIYQNVKDIIASSSFNHYSIRTHQRANSIREQPDGRELSASDLTAPANMVLENIDVPATKMCRRKSCNDEADDSSGDSLLDCAVKTKNSLSIKAITETYLDSVFVSRQGQMRIPDRQSQSSCSTFSELETYENQLHLCDHRKITDLIVKPSDAINNLVQPDNQCKECDEVILLQIEETASLASKIFSSKSSSVSRTPSTESTIVRTSSQGDAQTIQGEIEVFVVDIKKGKKGIGIGLVDGAVTILEEPGVYVRSLIPNGLFSKHSPTRHNCVIRCWVQDGRLQLGDRILAVNGVSLVNMNYYDAMRALHQAGDNVKLLVGRCGLQVAKLVTRSRC